MFRIVFGTANRLRSSSSHDRHIHTAGSMVLFVQSTHILGFTLDSSLTMNKHVTHTAAICNTYMYVPLRHVRTSLKTQAAVRIACASNNNHLD